MLLDWSRDLSYVAFSVQRYININKSQITISVLLVPQNEKQSNTSLDKLYFPMKRYCKCHEQKQTIKLLIPQNSDHYSDVKKYECFNML